jgi:hypothetical protein
VEGKDLRVGSRITKEIKTNRRKGRGNFFSISFVIQEYKNEPNIEQSISGNIEQTAYWWIIMRQMNT